MLVAGQYASETLDSVQVAWAQRIIDQAYTRTGVTDRDVVCALACVRQESRFYMYANDGTATSLSPAQQTAIKMSLTLPYDKIGRDSASVGLFQQQPFIPERTWGWGTIPQCMDVVFSTNAFMSGLLRILDRPSKPVTTLVQTVQRSAYPDAYAKHEPLAWALLQAYWKDRKPTTPLQEQVDGLAASVAAVRGEVDAIRQEMAIQHADVSEQNAVLHEMVTSLQEQQVLLADLVQQVRDHFV